MPNQLYLWLLTQAANTDCDAYDACVVTAYTQEAARKINPSDGVRWHDAKQRWSLTKRDGTEVEAGWLDKEWAPPESVVATRIGVVSEGSYAPGTVVCASFNPE